MASGPSPRGRAAGGQPASRQASEADTLNQLAADARTVQIPSPAERQRLLGAAGDGDRAAQDRLLQAHLGLVVESARRHTGEGLPAGDLFQEGSIGLMAAIRHFSTSEQADFEVFARGQIDLHIQAALAAEQAIERDQALLVAAAEDYERAEISVRRLLGRKATERELAEKLEWSVERTRQIGEMVEEARRRHDEELLQFLDPDRLEFGDAEPSDEEADGRRGADGA